jgi:hypothetical protein
MTRALVLVSLILLATACQTTRTRFDQSASYGFDSYTVTWSDGDKSRIFLQSLERNGHLAVCSHVVSENSPGNRDTQMAWYRVQTLYVNGQSAGSFDFIRLYGSDDFAPFQAGCIETGLPWTSAFEDPDYDLKGADRIIVKY